ncbi:MAG TPA: efflux RND transporter permease subunit [Pseudomonadales bacterium]|nr:efflux RND transporter permease subunit [Pseudomonadales bacterium]
MNEDNLAAFYDRCLKAVVSHPYLIICTYLFLLAFSLLQLVNVQTGKPLLDLDPSVNSILPENDQDREYFNRTRSLFSSGETILVALPGDDIFTTDNLKKIQVISKKLAALPQVERVSSLATAINIRSEHNDLYVDPFYKKPPTDKAEIAALKKRALEDPIFAGNLVSTDGKVACITVHLKDRPEKQLLADKIDEKIADIARQEWSQGDVWVTGGVHVKAAMTKGMLHDVTLIVPLAMFVMMLVSGFSFRTLRGVLIPLVTLSVGAVMTLAWVAWHYKTLNQVTVAVPVLLVVSNFAYSIHMLASYYDVLRNHKFATDSHETRKNSAIFYTLKDMILPVGYTGITTFIGFGSLATSPIPAIQQFGIASSIGVLISMVIALTLTPAILQILPTPKKIPKPAKENWADYRLAELAFFSMKNAKTIFVVAGVVCIIALIAIPRIKVGTDLVNSFKQDSKIRSDFYAVNKSLEGANVIYVVIDAGIPEPMQEPANLRAIETLQNWLKQQPEVGGSTSLVDYIKVINKGMHEDGSGFAIPASLGEITELMIIADNEDMKAFVDSRYQTARITVRTTATESSDIVALANRIEKFSSEHLPGNLHVEVTGNTYLVARTMDDIVWGQALGFGTAFLLIYLVMAFVLSSFKAGLVAMIPNVMPVLLFYGCLGWLGISLDITNSLIADVVLGIAVDDTIHLMAQFNRGAKNAADEKQGVVFALQNVGRPVLYTTLALCLGFLCMTMSDMQTQFEFGLLATGTLMAAWLIDMTLTPALASKMKIVTLWEVLRLDLGQEPHKSIPLFHGLSSKQARVAALLAAIKEYQPGDKIFVRGEKGEHMYVVIEGNLVVTLSNHDGAVLTREIGRGSIVGEVALYYGERTADVHARDHVRLLEITKHDLEQIQRRHPKIAAQLYANLNSVFASRVANLTTHIQA